MRYLTLVLIMVCGLQAGAQNTWLQKASFTGNGRDGHSSFVINNKIYFVGGWDFTTNYKELWEFDPATNVWTQKADFPGAGRRVGVAFAIGTKGYYGTGDNGSPFSTYLNDFYEYDAITDTWTQKGNFPGVGRYGAIAFVQNGYGYVGLGSAASTTYLQDIWMYNPTTDSWTVKNNFGGTARRYATTFNIGAKTYVGTGQGATGHGNTFYEYNYVSDTWTQKAGYPAGVSTAVGFDINGKGYILTGYNGTTYQQTMYEYNPIGDYWTQKANFGGGIRGVAIAASVNGLGYVCGGYGGGMHNDMWEYGPSVPAAPTASFAIPSSNICIGTCINITNQSTNSPDYFTWDLTGSSTPSSTVANPTGICYNTLGTYSISLIVSNSLGADTLVRVVNVVSVPSLTVTASSPTSCAGQAVTLTASGANTYSWSPTGLTNPTVVVTPTTTTIYTVTGRNTFNCSSAKTVSIAVSPRPTISVNSSSICAGKSFTINPSGAGIGGTYTITGGSAVVSPTVTSHYSVTGTSAAGCLSTNTAVSHVTVVASPSVSATTTSSLICSGQTVTLTASGASSYSWSPAGTGASISVTPSTTTTYSVVGSNTAGCVSTNTAVNQVSVVASSSVNAIASSTSICNGETTTLTATGADSYTWSPGGNTGASIIVSPSATSNYSVVGSSSTGCVVSNTAATQVMVVDSPMVMVSISNTVICSGTTVTLTASGASSYTWSPGGTGANLIITPSSTTDYSVIGSVEPGCVSANTAVTQVMVEASPSLSVSSTSSLICTGETVTLTVTGAGSYTWSTTETDSSIVVSPTNTSDYTVTGITGSCSSNAVYTQSVSVCTSVGTINKTDNLIYPNPFSNELYIQSSSSEKKELQVFNSLGVLVYKAELHDKEYMIDTGKLPPGIYYVKINSSVKKITKQ